MFGRLSQQFFLRKQIGKYNRNNAVCHNDVIQVSQCSDVLKPGRVLGKGRPVILMSCQQSSCFSVDQFNSTNRCSTDKQNQSAALLNQGELQDYRLDFNETNAKSEHKGCRLCTQRPIQVVDVCHNLEGIARSST